MASNERPGVALLLLAACAALGACGGGDDTPTTSRATAYGQVDGIDNSTTSGTYAWKGVPFAKAPVGALRWRAPVDPDAWTTPRSATKFANACVQYGRIYGPGTNNTYDATIGTTLNQTVGSEDCLYLNIWRPASGDTKLPVIVFIHGGSNVSGYTADPVYDGAMLAKTANAVVVTANYRLGIFGWLDLPQLKGGTNNANDDSGNFAILDNIKALQFVNKNIANFGGDAGNVTVMGQSAGAIDVYALLTSPLMVSANPKLFHKVVPLSGGLSLASELPTGSLPTLNPESTALAQGNALLYNLLITDGKATDNASARAYVATQTPVQISDYLRAKTPSTLLTILLTKLAAAGLSGSGPIPEGTVVPVNPIAAINAGNYVKVPVLAGNTRDEAKLFPTFLALPAFGGVSGRLVSDATLFTTQFNYNPDAAPTLTLGQWIPAALLPVNTPTTGFNARTDSFNAAFFGASRDNILNALKAQQPNVWYYRFDWDKEVAPWNDIYGAAHLFDLPFVFGNFGPSLFANVIGGTANKAGRLDLSDAMMKSIAAFAKNSDPNNAALGVAWPVWPAKLLFNATLTGRSISVQ